MRTHVQCRGLQKRGNFAYQDPLGALSTGPLQRAYVLRGFSILAPRPVVTSDSAYPSYPNARTDRTNSTHTTALGLDHKRTCNFLYERNLVLASRFRVFARSYYVKYISTVTVLQYNKHPAV
jgi:hypothetical protein